jgi:hypothetical protein
VNRKNRQTNTIKDRQRKKTWEDVRREVELQIRTREAAERENEKFRQTNEAPRIWQP